MHQMICPSCGTQFGLDDRRVSHEDLRAVWIGDGARWFSDSTSPPAEWNARAQVLRVLHVTEEDGVSLFRRRSERDAPCPRWTSSYSAPNQHDQGPHETREAAA